ncbi:hypothetical protein PGQ11_001959 [Apiospora arundinis]|uniref:Uncharacterized protein n=1 Tax=Apiospora arundinis TaxID=335852 RepID=A0ABR2JHP4_9PEZI
MAAPTFPEIGWWYSRCSSPSQVEASRNQQNWIPSAVCLHGTCCSNKAEGPLCTYEACKIIDEETSKREERNAGYLGGRDEEIWPQAAVLRWTFEVSSIGIDAS